MLFGIFLPLFYSASHYCSRGLMSAQLQESPFHRLCQRCLGYHEDLERVGQYMV